MTTLPTVEEVRGVIETAATDAQVQAAINDAALLVSACISSLTDAVGTAIVKYVTAHMLSMSPLASGGTGVVTSSHLGDASESYAHSPLGEGMLSTAYGRMAVAFDPNGCVASLGKRPAKFEVL